MKSSWIGVLVLLLVHSVRIGSTEAASSPAPTVPAAAGAASTPDSTGVPGQRTPVSVLTAPLVDWPDGADREALVYLVLSVTPEGTVSEMTVAERGFHEQRFVEAAKRGAKSMRFKPATIDGKPVDSCVVLPVAFMLGALAGGKETSWITGVTEEFRFDLNKIEKLFAKKDYEGVHRQAKLMEKRVRFAYEYAVLQAEMAQLHVSMQRNYPALRAAEAATIRTTPNPDRFDLDQPVPVNKASNYLLPAEVVSRLLQMRMQLAASSGALVGAMRAYRELAGLVKLPPDNPNVLLAAQITTLLKGREPLVAKGVLDFGDWRHDLFRTRFTFGRVDGSVEYMELICGDKRREIKYSPGEVCTVPASWESCIVEVQGTEGTVFTLVELADPAAAAS